MKAIAAEILGLFVDDQGLALAVLGVVVVALVAAFGLHASAVAGVVLVLGCLGALVVSTLKAGRGMITAVIPPPAPPRGAVPRA